MILTNFSQICQGKISLVDLTIFCHCKHFRTYQGFTIILMRFLVQSRVRQLTWLFCLNNHSRALLCTYTVLHPHFHSVVGVWLHCPMTASVTFSITDTNCTLSGIKTEYGFIGPLGFCGGSNSTQIDVLLTAYALTFSGGPGSRYQNKFLQGQLQITRSRPRFLHVIPFW